MKFTIRDVLWLMVVVAFAVAWWVEYRSHRVALQELNAETELREIHKSLAESFEKEADRLSMLLAQERARDDKPPTSSDSSPANDVSQPDTN